VPAAVVAQAWRDGARQARLARLLKGCDVVPLDDASAREVGELLGRAGVSDPADGSVALLAAGLGAAASHTWHLSSAAREDRQHAWDEDRAGHTAALGTSHGAMGLSRR